MSRLFFAIFCVFSSLVVAQENNFEEALEAYSQQDYKHAADILTTLIQDGFGGSTVHYNLGNTYFRLNEFGLARFHYEISLLMDSGNEDARHNIQLIENRVLPSEMHAANFAGFDVTLMRLLEVARPEILFWIGIISFILINTTVFLRLIKPDIVNGTALWLLLIPLGLVFLISVVVVGGFHLLDNQIQFGVVVESASHAYSEPTVRAPGKFAVPVAVKTRIKRYREGWYEIALPDNTTGWIRSDDLALISYETD